MSGDAATLHRLTRHGSALVQNIRRGHCELGVDARTRPRVAHAFSALARTI